MANCVHLNACRVPALQLGVSKSHVEKYVKRLLDKTNTSNRTELVSDARQARAQLCNRAVVQSIRASEQLVVVQQAHYLQRAPDPHPHF